MSRWVVDYYERSPESHGVVNDEKNPIRLLQRHVFGEDHRYPTLEDVETALRLTPAESGREYVGGTTYRFFRVYWTDEASEVTGDIKAPNFRTELLKAMWRLAGVGSEALVRHADKGDEEFEHWTCEHLAYAVIEELVEFMREDSAESRQRELGDVMAYLSALAVKTKTFDGSRS